VEKVEKGNVERGKGRKKIERGKRRNRKCRRGIRRKKKTEEENIEKENVEEETAEHSYRCLKKRYFRLFCSYWSLLQSAYFILCCISKFRPSLFIF
jgi:hypothetical protein